MEHTEHTESKGLVGMSELLKKFEEARAAGAPAKKTGGINSDRAYAVLHLMELMGEHLPTKEEWKMSRQEGENARHARYNKRFKYWLGRTRKLTTGQIWRLMASAKEGRNKGALFEHLMKKELAA